MLVAIDMELYRVFYTVASCKNISKAAEQLYISQPAISKSIRKLEKALGVQLFVRSSRGVRLTGEGSLFFEHVSNAMTELAVGKNVLDKLKANEAGAVKISVSTTLCKHLLIPHLETYIEENPHIKIRILNRSTADTLKLIDEGVIDFGIVSEPFDPEPYDFIRLTEIHDVFVACSRYLQTFDLNAGSIFAPPHALMLMEEDNVSRKYIDRYLLLNNLSVKPEIETGNMDILIEFSKLGLGVAALIREFITGELDSGELVEIPVSPPIPERSAGIVYKKNIPLPLAAKSLMVHLLQHTRSNHRP